MDTANAFSVLPRNRSFEIYSALDGENRSDHKIAMISEVDMSCAERLRAASQSRGGIKPTYTAFVAKAVALSLREHAHANRISIEWPLRKRIFQLRHVDISVAVEREPCGDGQPVFVGTLRDVDCKELGPITDELRCLARATPENSRRWRQFSWIVERLPLWVARIVLSIPRYFPSAWIEHRGGAALISSPAKYGVDVMFGTWPWPLAFSFGLVKERPVVVEGRLAIRPTMTLTMSFDRRLLTGAPAARFFRSVCAALEDADCLCGHASPAVDDAFAGIRETRGRTP